MFNFKKKKVINDDGIVVRENVINGKTEGYNRLKDNILFLNADGTKKVIQIESAVAHEGKTTVLCNLAVSLGLTDKKVAVVDLDFRRPKIQQKFELSNDGGIAEYMLGAASIEDIIKKTKYKNVDVVTRGGKIYNSALVLVSDKFKKLIADLREKYDFVLLDCAPVLQVSDYINVLSVSDGVLFVTAYGDTTRHQVSDAIKELRKNGAEILGSVLSKYDRKKDKGYSGKGYYGKGYYAEYRAVLEEESTDNGNK